MQKKIPCVMMRGGTSKGTFFLGSDLPDDPEALDRVLLAVMGSPDARQIDGVGGAHPLTSKVAIVNPSERPGIDLDYKFVQVVVDEPRTSTQQNCGNMLAGVGPFAIDQGLIKAAGPETTLTIYMENSDSIARVTFPTPDGHTEYEGTARIDGVPGSAAPIMIDFQGGEGATCGALFPTGNLRDTVQGIEVTLIDNGMPCVLFPAEAMDRTGYETVDALNADEALKKRIEALRLEVGHMMNLDDVTEKTVPKMTLLSPPVTGGAISTRSFIPHVCHTAIGVFAAVTVATACAIPGTVAADIAVVPDSERKLLSVEHPTGEFSVELEVGGTTEKPEIKRAALLRTARRLFEGSVLVPASAVAGNRELSTAAE